MKKILLVDDDQRQLNHLEGMLSSTFSIHKTDNPLTAWKNLSSIQYDAIVVDAHMPIVNGFELIEKLIQSKPSKMPSVFILSSDTSLPTKLQALKLGISDFLWPDMSREEIILRMTNRLENPLNEANLIMGYKGLRVDMNALTIYQKDAKLDLTQIEYKALAYLIAHPNTLIDRGVLKDHIWPGMVVLDKTLNTHLTNLRMKLKDSEIELKSIKAKGIMLS